MEDFNAQEKTESINIKDYYFILRRRWWLVVITLILALVAGHFHTKRQTPKYRAGITLLIEPFSNVNLVEFDSGFKGLSADYLNTQYRMITSRALARKVIEASGLKNVRPSSVAGMTRVSPVKGTWLVKVNMTGSNPKVITHLVNTLGETFIQEKVNDKANSSREAFSWLLQRVEELRTKVQESKKALVEFKKRENDISLGDRKSILEARITDLNSSYLDARRQRLELETLLAALAKYAKNKKHHLSMVPSIAGDPRLAPLQNEYFELESELIKMSRRYRDKHPEIRKIRHQLNNLKTRIDQEIVKIIETIEIDYALQQNRETTYAQIISKLKKQYINMDQRVSEYSILEQEARTNRELYDVLLVRLKETQLAETLPSTNIRILERAKEPKSPISPKPEKNRMIAIVVGLMLGLGLAIGLEFLDDTIKKPEDIEELAKGSFLGIIPKLDEMTGKFPKSAQLEPYRTLVTNIDIELRTKGVRRILVSSCLPSEGKSTTVKNLGFCFAKAGKRIIEIDADLRKPNLHKLYGVHVSPGLTDSITDVENGDWRIFLRSSSKKHIELLPAGTHRKDVANLYHTPKIKKILEQAIEGHDYLLVDSPPLTVGADALSLASSLDAVLLVVRHGKTSKKALRAVLKDLSRIEGIHVGVILNGVDLKNVSQMSFTNYYYHYYSSYYSERKDGENQERKRKPRKIRKLRA